MPYPSGQLGLEATAFLLLSHNAWLREKTGSQWCCKALEQDQEWLWDLSEQCTPPACSAGAGMQLNSSDKDRNPSLCQHCFPQGLVTPSAPAGDPNSPLTRQVGGTPAKQGCSNTRSANILLSLKLAPLSNFSFTTENILQLLCNWEDWRKKEAWVLLPVPSSNC